MNTQRLRTSALVALALVASLLLSACASGPTSSYSRIKRTVVDAKDDLLGTRPTAGELFPEDNTPLIEINEDAADTMMGLFMPALNKNSPIYVQPLANRVAPGDPSPFGALVAEQVAARWALRGFMITEGQARKPAPRSAPAPADTPQGLALSGPEAKAGEKRSQEELNRPQPCLLSGTYLIADKVIYISAKLAALESGQVMAAHSWTIPVNRNTRALLPQLKQSGGMTPSVRTSLNGSPHKIANPQGQPQNYVNRDLVR